MLHIRLVRDRVDAMLLNTSVSCLIAVHANDPRRRSFDGNNLRDSGDFCWSFSFSRNLFSGF